MIRSELQKPATAETSNPSFLTFCTWGCLGSGWEQRLAGTLMRSRLSSAGWRVGALPGSVPREEAAVAGDGATRSWGFRTEGLPATRPELCISTTSCSDDE